VGGDTAQPVGRAAAPAPARGAGQQPARILLLDEPTNFLDFDALDVIEEALRRYRYFADAVAHTRRWHVAAGAVIDS